MPNSDRIDHQLASFEQDREMLRKHVGHELKSRRLAKTAAYRMAKEYVAMQSSDHNRLVDIIKSTHGKEPDPIAAWLDESFAPLGSIGEDHAELLKAVHRGMTLKQYLASTPAVFLNDKKRKASASNGVAPVPSEPSPTLPIDEQNEVLRNRCRALEARVRELTSRDATSQRRIAILEKTIKQLQKTLRALEALA